MVLFHTQYPRTIPARRPTNFEPPSVRYSLRWRKPVPELVADWFGIQDAEPGSPAGRNFLDNLRNAMSGHLRPDATEVMVCPEDETGRPAVVVVAYWTSASAHARWSSRSEWAPWWNAPSRMDDGVGYWRETIACPYERHETVFSRDYYRIGLGRTPDTEIVQITDNGYFGAARDRLPISAVDQLASPLGTHVSYDPGLDPQGRRVLVLTPLNTTMIRSGQFWHDSEPEQAEDYEKALQPKLDRGMDYLARNEDTGCVYLRKLVNLDDNLHRRRETSVYAAFQEFAGLESWAEDHPTHNAIYGHQIAMGKKYGARRDVVTWHEVFVLPANNRFEYINCAPGTGMTRVGPMLTICK
ncbi:MAG: phenylacetaldoxime dehydratase family protein [Comamonadaceae bacterium]|nr:MAG: phenylacetaldoxime dehydratase family protein [Comamonadaceae bacterium]